MTLGQLSLTYGAYPTVGVMTKAYRVPNVDKISIVILAINLSFSSAEALPASPASPRILPSKRASIKKKLFNQRVVSPK